MLAFTLNHPDINTKTSTQTMANDSIKYRNVVAKGAATSSSFKGRGRQMKLAWMIKTINMARFRNNSKFDSLSFNTLLHLLIQILSFLLVLKVRDKLLDGRNHIILGEITLE